MLEVRLIGRFDVRFNGDLVHLSTRASQSLFAYLILTAGTSHRREKLAGLFWPDLSEKKARTSLRQELWRIRKALSTKAKNEYLISDDISLSFDKSVPYWLDAESLRDLDDRSSKDELVQALSLYQGEFLPGFYDEWVSGEREYLQSLFEKRMAQLLTLLEAEKRWPEIVQWADRWISFCPTQEAAYRTLIAAYRALGDRTKVLSTYERCVKALQELDLEPSEETRALAFKKNSRINLPIPLTSFIGRDRELGDVADLMQKTRLVTLTGSGGVGKTRLAIQVAADLTERYPDGIWFLDLVSLNDPEYLPNTLANLLGLLELGDPKSSVLDQLTGFFQSRKALIIFDNCEHLIATCAQLAHSLLSSCAGLFILATSRESLRVPGEIPYRVPSLDLPLKPGEEPLERIEAYSSIQLFAERAKVASPDFTVHPENVLSIVKVCERLDGIPLAIELAAARTNVLTVEQISARLEDSIRLLNHGLRSAPLRHETLKATIEWSVQLLSEQERLLFRRLAIFAGGWTLEAAEAVCSGNGLQSVDILDLLSQLVNKSLVIVKRSTEGSRHPSAGMKRYHMLETIRQYARERLFTDDQAPILQNRHLNYFLQVSEEAEPQLVGARQSEWMDSLESELDNIRLALDWSISNGKSEEALRLFGALNWFWIIRCHFQEGIQWFRRAADRGEQVATEVDAKALGAVGVLLWIHQSASSSRDALQRSVALYRELGNQWELSNRLLALGVTELSDQNLAQARSLFEQALAIGREVGNMPTVTRALFNLADISCRDGNPGAAAPLFEESLAICRQLEDDHLTTMVLLNVGDYAFGQQDYVNARDDYQEALEISLKLKNKWVAVLSLLGIADILCGVEMYPQSTRLQGYAVKVLTELGAKLLENDMLSFRKTRTRLIDILGEETYNREFEMGKRLHLDQAMEIASHLEL